MALLTSDAMSARKGQVAGPSTKGNAPVRVRRESAGADNRYPITLGRVKGSSFPAMEAKVEAISAMEPGLTGAQRRALEAGKILSSWAAMPDGTVKELTRGTVDAPLEAFLRKIPAKDWGKNLADWKGGAVEVLGNGRQIERMVIAAPGPDMDMTKIESIKNIRGASGEFKGVRVLWEVLKSDNGSTLKDVGLLRLERFGEGKTLVTFHSAHRLGSPPFGWKFVPAWLNDWLHGQALTRTFTKHIASYRKIVLR